MLLEYNQSIILTECSNFVFKSGIGRLPGVILLQVLSGSVVWRIIFPSIVRMSSIHIESIDWPSFGLSSQITTYLRPDLLGMVWE